MKRAGGRQADAHEQGVHGKGTEGDAKDEEESGDVGPAGTAALHAVGDEGIKGAHEKAGEDAEGHAAPAGCG